MPKVTAKPEVTDRPTKDIIRSVMLLITSNKIKGQFARDLEKLCTLAMIAEATLAQRANVPSPTE